MEIHPEYAEGRRVSNFHFTTNGIADFTPEGGPITLATLRVSPHRENALCADCPRQWSCLMGDRKCEATMRIWGHPHVAFYSHSKENPYEYVEIYDNGKPGLLPLHYADLVFLAEPGIEHPLGGGAISFDVHGKPLVFLSTHDVGDDAMGDSLNREQGDIIRIPNLEEFYAYFVQSTRARYHPNGGVRADQHRGEAQEGSVPL